MRAALKPRSRFVSLGMRQPSLPNKSTLLRIRSRSGQAIAAPSCVKHFRLKQRQVHVRRTFRRATFAGETVAQRGVELGGFQSGVVAPIYVRSSSAARMILARPRVDITSSCVAMNVGHMMPLCLRQPPQPLHCSRLPVNDRSLNANASTG